MTRPSRSTTRDWSSQNGRPGVGLGEALSLSGVDLMAEPAQLDPQLLRWSPTDDSKKCPPLSTSRITVQSEARRALPAPCGLSRGQPPSVKGLKQVSFSEQEEGVWSSPTGRPSRMPPCGESCAISDRPLQSGRGRKSPAGMAANSLREEAYRDTLSQDAAGAHSVRQARGRLPQVTRNHR